MEEVTVSELGMGGLQQSSYDRDGGRGGIAHSVLTLQLQAEADPPPPNLRNEWGNIRSVSIKSDDVIESKVQRELICVLCNTR